MSGLPVWIEPGHSGGYAVALAELPLSTRRAEGIDGAIAVVATSEGVQQAMGAQPVAIVLRPTAGIDAAVLDDLLRHAPSIPVIVDRRLLRLDAVAAARSDLRAFPSRYVTVDLVTPPDEYDAVVVDAIGWFRELAGGPCRPVTQAGTKGAAIALLESQASGAGLMLSVSLTPPHARGVQLRVTSVAEHRVEVVIDERAHLLRISHASRESDLTAPALAETRERLTLRRAVAALSDGTNPTDLADLLADLSAAHDVRRTPVGA